MTIRDHFKTLLRQKGLKATPARLSLLVLLEQENKPMSAKDLTDHPRLANMDQATLYRSLTSLKEAGLIRPIGFEERFSFYEIASKGDHHHLVCVHCGRIEEVEGCPAQELAQAALDHSSGFATVLRHSLEFYGICRSCTQTA